MKLGGCPDDGKLESLLYGGLTTLELASVRFHTFFCPTCRQRLSELRNLQSVLSKIPRVEPPEGFLESVLAAVDSWEFPPPSEGVEWVGPADEAEGETSAAQLGRLKFRWALGTASFFVMSLLQWRFSDSLPPLFQGRYLMSFADLNGLWKFIFSGAWLRSLRDIAMAIRVDGISSLKILGGTVPSQVAGVFVFGGIVTAVFITQLRSSRSGGDEA